MAGRHPHRGRGPGHLCHDLGQGVEQIWGCSEYEFERRLSAAEVTTLRELLTVPAGGDLLAAIDEQFPSTSDLERFAEDHGIVASFGAGSATEWHSKLAMA